jgi:hypothetical protein
MNWKWKAGLVWHSYKAMMGKYKREKNPKPKIQSKTLGIVGEDAEGSNFGNG